MQAALDCIKVACDPANRCHKETHEVSRKHKSHPAKDEFERLYEGAIKLRNITNAPIPIIIQKMTVAALSMDFPGSLNILPPYLKQCFRSSVQYTKNEQQRPCFLKHPSFSFHMSETHSFHTPHHRRLKNEREIQQKMDSFDALMRESAQASAQGGMSFEDALNAILDDQLHEPAAADATNTETAGTRADDRALLATLRDMAAVIRHVVPVQIETVLEKEGWTDSERDDYPFQYTYRHEVFETHKCSDMYIAPRSSMDALCAGLYSVTDTGNGYVRLLSRLAPEADLYVTFKVRAVLDTREGENEWTE